MSTFAVFGMTGTFARTEAKKKGCGTSSEILYYVDWLIGSNRKVRLSPLFDSPAFCSEWITLCQKTEERYRDLRIRAQVRIKSPEGSKKPYKTQWVDDWQNFNMELAQ